MRAVLSLQPGPPELLSVGTLPDPKPGPGQVLLGVRACGANYFDFLLVQDKHFTTPPRPFSPGGEAAGVVEALGEGVDSLKIGDRVVIGSLPFGAMAEKLAVDAKYCNPIPDAMPFEVAAGYSLTYGTSYYALKNCAQMRPGETLLVLGAAGGVGLAAVELGKAMGARVIAAVSSQEKLEMALACGADSGVVYPRGPFDKAGAKALAELFKSACGPSRQADVIYDPVGGEYSEAAIRCMAADGRSLIVGFPSGIPRLPLNLVVLKYCRVIGVGWGPWVWRRPEESRQNMRELAQMYSEGKIMPLISKVFPFAEAGRAIAWIGARQAVGKAVVTTA